MPHRLKPVAQRLRREATPAEKQLWRSINNRQVAGFKLRRQVIIDDYAVDFACFEARLVIEIDGATHSTDAEIARDAQRSRVIGSQGYDVLRFQNRASYDNVDGVVETIRRRLFELRPRVQGGEIARPPTLTLPRKGGGDANEQR